MEVDYIIERLGPYLGGIDVEKVREALRREHVGVERVLGIEIEEGPSVEELECVRIRSFAEHYAEEEKKLRALYNELRALGISPSDMAQLRGKIRAARRRARMYREMLKKCQGRSVTSSFSPQS
ncbi:MAG: hypothetical protein QW677_05415 [Pyrobaculum sp.]|uniref:Uncharacterized protein n=3 Tax=Pyrobaculum TaxID=2276 RepID=A4WLG4_PYRAR|nr:hypothetical protein [Pyrobaculum arsenaticum]ABP51231.1 conserved hypothetical protein [Pyrobaculum arsenaticum DSM 13514]AFA38485.1 hypothetical protein Pogu_0458 [Pyrobaculum oguniense TE7]MCY0891815.1 hypothetical protein [Pyrobaculum arsenaticum]NYR16400.1 hypothetical protein [Pyrobaculum arsenaticum]